MKQILQVSAAAYRANFLLNLRALLLKLGLAILNWRLLADILALLFVVLSGAHLTAAPRVLGRTLLAGQCLGNGNIT